MSDPHGALRLLRAGPLRSLSLRFGRDDRDEVGRVYVLAIEDDVVAFAVTVGTGDAETVTGGGEGEG